MSNQNKQMTVNNIFRLIIVPWYLFGWVVHVYLGLANPEIYQVFGSTALIPAYTTFWNETVMPNITLLAFLLAAFEIAVGLMLSAKGKWVKIGLICSILFNLFLIQMGLSYATADIWSDFAINRLPNIIFVALQIPLFWGDYQKNLSSVIKGWFSKNSK